MNKFEFLTELRAKLWALSAEDAQRSLDYYAEMIDDRMEDGLSEEDAVAAIGDLDEIVKQIQQEMPQPPAAVEKEQTQQKKPRPMGVWMILLLVLGAPLWIPLLVAVFAVIMSVVVALWSVVIALYAATVALAVSAIGMVAAAFSLLWIRRFGKGAVLLGGAFICAGLAILLFMLSNLTAKGMAWLSRQMFRGIWTIFSRKERTA